MKKQIISPIQYLQKEMHDKALMVRMMADLTAIHKDFVTKHEELKQFISNMHKKGDRGDKGDKPTYDELLSIIKPLLGDILHEKKLIDLIKPLIPVVKHGKTPTKDELVSLITPLIPKIPEVKDKKIVITEDHIDKIAERAVKKIKLPTSKNVGEIDIENLLSLIEKRPKGKRLNMDFIDGLSQTIQSLSSQITSKGYLHGGGDTITAGSNITITTDANGKKVITASGGGGSGTILTATGSVDDSNIAFTFVSKPTEININGSYYIENHGWTWNSGTLTATLSNPVGTGGYIYGKG